ncbi:hypothetical protein MASR1M32_25950 [Rhodobacter sp.]
MFPQQPRLDLPPAASAGVVDLLTRAVSGLYEGLMPGARLEALIDHLEMRK